MAPQQSDYDAPAYRDRRKHGYCDECGAIRQLNPIYDSHSADITARLCDECRDKRLERLEAMYRGE